MKTIEERAKEYAQAIYGYAPAIEIAFIRGARSEHELLTRWHDPKEELPDSNKTVLVKVIDELDNESICLGTREGDEYTIDDAGEFRVGVCFDNESMPDMNVKVIGWREIL